MSHPRQRAHLGLGRPSTSAFLPHPTPSPPGPQSAGRDFFKTVTQHSMAGSRGQSQRPRSGHGPPGLKVGPRPTPQHSRPFSSFLRCTLGAHRTWPGLARGTQGRPTQVRSLGETGANRWGRRAAGRRRGLPNKVPGAPTCRAKVEGIIPPKDTHLNSKTCKQPAGQGGPAGGI